jgi:hypothetical protein
MGGSEETAARGSAREPSPIATAARAFVEVDAPAA